MSTSKQYDGPLLSVTVTPSTSAVGAYGWEIMMSAADSSGERKLGYTANGVLTTLDKVSEDFEIKVHDEDRAAWTPMPLTHRKDVRAAMTSLIAQAAGTLKAMKHS